MSRLLIRRAEVFIFLHRQRDSIDFGQFSQRPSGVGVLAGRIGQSGSFMERAGENFWAAQRLPCHVFGFYGDDAGLDFGLAWAVHA